MDIPRLARPAWIFRGQPAQRGRVPAQAPPPRLVERDNEGGDFAAWAAGLQHAEADAEHFVFVNDTARGPFVPRYAPSETSWPELFCCRIDDRVKLVGASINRMVNWEPRWRCPHIQTHAWATDATGIALLQSAGVFSPEPDPQKRIVACDALRNGLVVPGEDPAKIAYVFEHEIKASKVVAEAGFEIFGFQLAETTGS